MPITPELGDIAKRDIFTFIRDLLELLNSIIREPYGAEGALILEEMIPPLQKAWEEFQGDFSIGRAEEQIFGVSDQVLEDHGLYGEQASAKRHLFDIRLGLFNGNRTKRALLWLLDAADTYLDSITEATGLSGALKEIKEVLRNSIGD